MKNSLVMDFSVDKPMSTVIIKKEFASTLDNVWAAWTEKEILDQWWAPLPWKAKTKSMDFKVGGRRLYAMVGPEGEEHWALADYTSITPKTNFKQLDAFCDSEGNLNNEFPRSDWNVDFKEANGSTFVTVKIKHKTLDDLEKIISLGFKEGFTMAVENLDAYIAQRFKLRNELKKDSTARVVTYLNFPGNTEEAMLFYKSVFKTEFNGNGIQRFGSIPEGPGQPPIPENIKNMILHVELPTLGGHVLMATDAPKEMGFTLIQGNNMHISLEPESRAEAQRLFDALSEGGNVTMPLQDMFFGSFFGEFSDKYGINWMINFKNPEK